MPNQLVGLEDIAPCHRQARRGYPRRRTPTDQDLQSRHCRGHTLIVGPLSTDPLDHAPAAQFERRLIAEIDGGQG